MLDAPPQEADSLPANKGLAQEVQVMLDAHQGKHNSNFPAAIKRIVYKVMRGWGCAAALYICLS